MAIILTPDLEAVPLLDESSGTTHYIPELCSAIGVSDRTLRFCCQEHLRMGPRRYILLRRLRLARRALLDSTLTETTVTKVAMRYGFFELGRFAAEHKSLFGELPSATLAREPVKGAEQPRGDNRAERILIPKLHRQHV
jgi:AraC-like DNA-binding protein